MTRLFFTITIVIFTTACSEKMAQEICSARDNCTLVCPDGTITNSRPPKCPINDRDLLPPPNDNVGIEGMKGNR